MHTSTGPRVKNTRYHNETNIIDNNYVNLQFLRPGPISYRNENNYTKWK